MAGLIPLKSRLLPLLFDYHRRYGTMRPANVRSAHSHQGFLQGPACPSDPRCDEIASPERSHDRASSHGGLPSLNRAAPYAVKSLVQNDYFDPYYPDSDHHSPLSKKDFRYAYQREMRFILDPEDGAPLAGGGALFVSIGSIADIAAVYDKNGQKVEGTGPNSFLA